MTPSDGSRQAETVGTAETAPAAQYARSAQTVYRQHRFTPPPGSCEILLIRHGESQPAYPGRPFPLTDGHADPS